VVSEKPAKLFLERDRHIFYRWRDRLPSDSSLYRQQTRCARVGEKRGAELGEFNIGVNAIAPGRIDNRMLRSLETQFSPENPDVMRDLSKERIAMKRMGTSEEVAHLAAFLASDHSSYCNGSIHLMDGGYTAA
jgi:NAD(P)-dependent dehydrogenase (short-subunit alcohol dehydrogenase family)